MSAGQRPDVAVADIAGQAALAVEIMAAAGTPLYDRLIVELSPHNLRTLVGTLSAWLEATGRTLLGDDWLQAFALSVADGTYAEDIDE